VRFIVQKDWGSWEGRFGWAAGLVYAVRKGGKDIPFTWDGDTRSIKIHDESYLKTVCELYWVSIDNERERSWCLLYQSELARLRRAETAP